MAATNDGSVPSTNASDYCSLHLISTRVLERLYDDLPSGDIGLSMIAEELERRGAEEWC